jgi:hypothetical protein
LEGGAWFWAAIPQRGETNRLKRAGNRCFLDWIDLGKQS